MRTREQVIREALDAEYQQAVATLTSNQRDLLEKIDASWHNAPPRQRSTIEDHQRNLYDLVYRTVVKSHDGGE